MSRTADEAVVDALTPEDLLGCPKCGQRVVQPDGKVHCHICMPAEQITAFLRQHGIKPTPIRGGRS